MSVPVPKPLASRPGVRFALVALFLSAMFLLAVDSMQQESLTIDEPIHLVSGYTAWAFNDYRLQGNHGELPERWVALPLLLENVKFPSRDNEVWRRPGYMAWQVCQDFYFNSGNDPDAIVFSGRLMAVVMTLLTALAVYAWTTRVFGHKAALLACFLCALDTTMLAHGRLTTSDVAAALFFLMGVGCFWSLLRRFTYFRLAASAVCFGLLMVSKMSGGLLAVMALLMFLFRVALGRPWPVRLSGFRPRQVRTLSGKAWLAGATALSHAAVGLVIIWCFYGWQHKPSPDWRADRDAYSEPRETVYGALGSSRATLVTLERWGLLPEAYLYGLAHTMKDSAQWPAFLNGQYSVKGWWYYLPYCFIVKTPLPLLALIALGAVSVFRRVGCRRTRRRVALWVWLDRTSLIWSLLLVYGTAAVFTHLNIGHRHLLPVYPPLFMLAGAAAWWLMRGSRWTRATMVLLAALQVVVIARIHPYYIAYFNELAGGPGKGYRHLADSNVDWGQDLPSLARWLCDPRNLAAGGESYIDYFGFDSPQRWGIQARPLPSLDNPRFSSADPVTCQAGTYAISATMLVRPGARKPPWDGDREREYKDILAKLREMEKATPPRPGDAENLKMWRTFLARFADLQYSRVRSYLIGREPDAMIGYSILVFRLSDAELHAALLP